MSNKKIKESAEGHFSKGLYCAESVVLSIVESQGIDSELFPKAATAFCSGMSRSCGTCGALTGAVMGLSVVLGRNNQEESVKDVYAATGELISSFENEFGSRNCHQLLGCDLGSSDGQAYFKQEKLHKRCLNYTSRAAELAGNILSRINNQNC
jgi:C_GCAxxG_C_C family probable redox protein